MNASDRETKRHLELQLAKLLRYEELKWLQGSREKGILQGDNNTKYYHAKANGRTRKNSISSLHQEKGIIEGELELMKYISEFYKTLFGHPDTFTISLNMDDVKTSSEHDIEVLTNRFTIDEFKK